MEKGGQENNVSAKEENELPPRRQVDVPQPGYDHGNVSRHLNVAVENQPQLATPSLPSFQSVQMGVARTGGASLKRAPLDPKLTADRFAQKETLKQPIINKNKRKKLTKKRSSKVQWSHEATIEEQPKYYILEPNSLMLGAKSFVFEDLKAKMKRVFRELGVHAKYFDVPASAVIKTEENVEIYLSLWKSRDGDDVILELQRRSGDSITFQRYAHCIRQAALGNFRPTEATQTIAEKDLQELKEMQDLLRSELALSEEKEIEEATGSLEFVVALLKKEFMDARISGVQSVLVLVDPARTGVATCVVVSLAVLLGEVPGCSDNSNASYIRDFLLSVIQEGKMVDEVDNTEKDETEPFYDSDSAQNYFSDEEEEPRSKPSDIREGIRVLKSIIYMIFALALENMVGLQTVTDTSPALAEMLASVEPKAVVESFLLHALEMSGIDFRTTQMRTVERVKRRPLNAIPAVRTMRYLKELTGVGLDAEGEATVNAALKYGKEFNAKLEKECELLLSVGN